MAPVPIVQPLTPQAGQQTLFLESRADIVIYGGAAGGGKSYGLLLECLRRISKPYFNAVIFRRTLQDARKPGSIVDVSRSLYPQTGGAFVQTPQMEWKWGDPDRGGAKIQFGHVEHDNALDDWQGSQIVLLCFDELTHFSRYAFFYLLARNRTAACPVKPYVRATCNPDADSWVAEFIAWWIDDDGYAIPERGGRIRYFVRVNGEQIVWADTKRELIERFPEYTKDMILSVTFIPSKLSDNPALLKNNPQYKANLLSMDAVNRGRMLDGNWKIRAAAGLLFKRSWVKFIDVIPADVVEWCRGWDLAATPKTENNDPDWTWGVLMGRLTNGQYVVVDAVACRDTPAGVMAEVKATAEYDGHEVMISIPQDPGQAGKGQVVEYSRELAGFNVRFRVMSGQGDKVTRFQGFSAQAEHGNVLVLRGPWNAAWIAALEAFPEAKHDDAVDATSESFHRLSTMRPRKLILSTVK
jgi:predicted phage terminase large subunit-like protein